MSLKAVSLFAGIGGFDLGLERNGFTITHQVELEPFCQRVLAARFPYATCWPDVREWTGHGHEPVDLLCGGFPCQDLSVAGKRAGLAGSRSGLFWEIVRIAKASKPTWGLFENVPGLFSAGGGRDMATVMEGLRQCWPVVGYAVLDSQHFGVPQRRRRVFFVCGPTESGVEQVLFNHEGRDWDSPTGDEARTDIAASLRSRSHKPGVNPPGRGGEDDQNIVCALIARDSKGAGRGDSSAKSKLVCQALTNLGSGGPDDNEAQAGHLVTDSLRAEGFDASEDGTGRGTPIVAETLRSGGNRTGGDRPPGSDVDTAATYLKPEQNGVRRLTPTEYERLQGFPDGWTCLCQPIDRYDAHRCTCPDGPRYKALGNAVTVNVIEWLGQRILTGVSR